MELLHSPVIIFMSNVEKINEIDEVRSEVFLLNVVEEVGENHLLPTFDSQLINAVELSNQ